MDSEVAKVTESERQMERELQEVEAEVEAAMAKLIGMTEQEEQAQELRHNVQNEEEKIAKQIR